MPMQLTAAELDAIHTVTGQGKSANEVYAHICANRGRARKPKLDVGTVRRPMKGHPHQQSEPETRTSRVSQRPVAASGRCYAAAQQCDGNELSLWSPSDGRPQPHWWLHLSPRMPQPCMFKLCTNYVQTMYKLCANYVQTHVRTRVTRSAYYQPCCIL